MKLEVTLNWDGETLSGNHGMEWLIARTEPPAGAWWVVAERNGVFTCSGISKATMRSNGKGQTYFSGMLNCRCAVARGRNSVGDMVEFLLVSAGATRAAELLRMKEAVAAPPPAAVVKAAAAEEQAAKEAAAKEARKIAMPWPMRDGHLAADAARYAAAGVGVDCSGPMTAVLMGLVKQKPEYNTTVARAAITVFTLVRQIAEGDEARIAGALARAREVCRFPDAPEPDADADAV